MASPTDPVLTWLRELIQRRALNTATLSNKTGLSRGRIRKLLSGSQPMLVDELMKIASALEISPADMGMPELQALDGPPEASPVEEASVIEDLRPGPPAFSLDPFGNHAEQIFQIAFALGCDFLFTADVAKLGDSGIPASILEQYRRPGTLLIKLEALYHHANAPRFHDDGITLTLSFDGLYDCTFPWSSVQQITLDVLREPDEDEDEDEDEPEDTPRDDGPRLRLVT